MNNKSKTILGISLGSQHVGYAVMKLGELVDWGNKTFKGPWSDQKILLIVWALEKIIDRYEITQLNVKVPPFLNRYESLDLLMKNIRELARNKNISIYQYDVVYNPVKVAEKISKRKFLGRIAKRFPYVSREFADDDEQQVYYTKTLEAVAMAEMG